MEEFLKPDVGTRSAFKYGLEIASTNDAVKSLQTLLTLRLEQPQIEQAECDLATLEAIHAETAHEFETIVRGFQRGIELSAARIAEQRKTIETYWQSVQAAETTCSLLLQPETLLRASAMTEEQLNEHISLIQDSLNGIEPSKR